MIVTGGTYGIGKAISLVLAEAGHDVVSFGLDAPQPTSEAQDGTNRLRSDAAQRGLTLTAMEADVSVASDIERVVQATLERHGRVDALVNNAAIGPLGTILDTDEALWDRIIDVNLKGVYLTSRTVLPHLLRQGGGSIVNVGSGAGWGKANMAAYAASKGGLFALSASMAYDFFRDRVRVNVVIPGGGGIVTGMSLGRVGGDRAKLGAGSSGTAAGRPATAEDLAHTVAFLLSPQAEVISGAIIDVGSFAHQGGPIPPERPN